jgi:hypothetical protein
MYSCLKFFMSKTKEIILIFVIPFSLSILCMFYALYVLPENCSLFVSNVPGPQMCHTIQISDDGKLSPDNCLESFCQDLSSETTATLIFSFGMLLFFLPPILKMYSESQSQETEQIKLT